MQTFLPFDDYKKSAFALDGARLRNQRGECKTIFQALENKDHWFNHPATRMWWGYEHQLILYTLTIMDECARMGTSSISRGWFESRLDRYPNRVPHWLGSSDFHIAHKSNLLRKQPSHYRDLLGWQEPDNLPYIWPGSYYAYHRLSK